MMWNLTKIEEYISNGVEENIHLDYKGADSLGKSEGKKKEISKDVSSFANSDGGVIIYGVREFDETGKKHLPEKIDPINREEISKEWLEQIINSNIYPRIRGIKITPISRDKNNQVIYVVEIPKSDTAHQAKDKRYYRRFNFESVPMLDWEIKDIINRANKTKIVLQLKPDIEIDLLRSMIKNSPDFQVIIKIWALNEGNVVSRFLRCFVTGDAETASCIFIPRKHLDKNFQIRFSNEKERKIRLEHDDVVIGVERNPILPKTRIYLGKLGLKSKFFTDNVLLRIQISTEDNTRLVEKRGVELLENFSKNE